MRRNTGRYSPLRDDPTSPSWQVLEDWRLYRSRLVTEFRATPVFDESFAVDQLYGPTQCLA